MNYSVSLTRGLVFVMMVMVPMIGFAASTQADIKARYAEGGQVKVLIVPGHDDTFSGAKFKTIKESEINLLLAKKISEALGKDLQISVTVSRDSKGYLPALYTYFQTKTRSINAFIKSHALAMKQEIAKGSVVVPKQVPHANAPVIPMYRLYATNKWATEEGYDIVIHVHFNDEGNRPKDVVGLYRGYSVYVPDSQLPGWEDSRVLGNSIGKNLSKHFKVSTLSYESSRANKYGVIPDLRLIALGSNKTAAMPRVLVEYAYLYESSLSESRIDKTTDRMMTATVSGIYDFLGKNIHESSK